MIESADVTNSPARIPPQAKHLDELDARWPVMAAILAGLAVRLLFLGSKSIWLDEALSISFAADPSGLFSAGFDHSHPPLYYILLHYWLPLGRSEFTLRLSSALVGSLAIPLTYVLARHVGGRSVASTTTWLVALSPLLVWYSQELRSYSLLTTVGLVTGVALVYLLTRPNFWWWLLFVVAMTASFYIHYSALLLVAAQVGLGAVLHHQQRVTRAGVLLWLAAWPVVLLLYLPWLTSPGMRAFAGMVFTADFYPVELLTSTLSVSPTVASVILVLGLALFMLAVVALGYSLMRQGASFWLEWAASPTVRAVVLLLFLFATAVSVIPRVYTLKKLVIDLWPYGLLIVGWIFPWKQANRSWLALLLSASLVGCLLNVTIVPKDQWREMAAYLSAQAQPGDTVWVLPGYHTIPLYYYLSNASTPVEIPPVEIPAVSGDMSDEQLATLAGEDRRVWLVYHTANFDVADPERRVEQWLDAHFDATDRLQLYRMDVTLYAPRP